MSSTLKDIANKLDVSVSTVSRVVNNKKYVKPETRQLILEAMNDMDYMPNQVARSLKKRSTNTIGIIVPDISDDFFSHVIKGVDNILSSNGYYLVLCDTAEDPDKEEMYLNLYSEKQIDGMILATVNQKHKVVDRLLANGTPIIFIDNLPPLRNNFDSVIIDNNKASYIAIDHLIQQGHRNIGMITGKTNETTGYERLRGYKAALCENNIEPNEAYIKAGDFKEASGYANMKELLKCDDLTAVYVASSKMTYGAIKAIIEKGLNIPKDISVIGFDIHDESGLMSPSITTMLQPEDRIGKVAAELLIKKLKNTDDKYTQKIVLDPALVIRNSTGKVKG